MSSENSGYAEGSSRKVLSLIGRGVVAFHDVDAMFEKQEMLAFGVRLLLEGGYRISTDKTVTAYLIV